ncbi:MAG: hypothetical protein JWN50_680 [Parcubacteria group bacterium]|nr:hypothetical protein [Parcubacteria group bacterium]
MAPVSITAIVLAALASFILGFLFHGPLLGKWWIKLADIHPTGNEKFSNMIPQMFWNLVANLVTAYALAVVYAFASTSAYTSGASVHTGILTGILVWLGFLVTSSSIEVIWMGRKKSLWFFEAACSLVVMIVMGAIIASF